MSSLAIDFATMDQEAEGDQELKPTEWTLQVDTAERGFVAPVTLMTSLDRVTWYFAGVPAGYLPEIHFLEAENPSPSKTGPFASFIDPIRAENGFDFRITGFGNNGIGGTYSYAVFLVQPGAEGIRNKVDFVEDPHIDNQGAPPTA